MEANTTVRQILNQKGGDVLTVSPSATVLTALEKMAEINVGSVVVVDETGVCGIFTERDYARKVILHGKRSHDLALREVMTGSVITVGPQTTVRHCLEIMTERRLRHLPVLEDDRLVGLISIGDAVKAIISEQEFLIEQLQSYIGGGYGGASA